MAEGLVNHYLKDEFEAFSAGTMPAGINPRTAVVMEEVGADISNQTSKHLNEIPDIEFDHVITLCDHADASCPAYWGGTKKVHIGFPDPIRAKGTDDEIMEQFRSVRDQIREKVISYLKKGLSHLNE